jgi:hypothetical protein
MRVAETTRENADDLDDLLRAFFRRQLPKRWPAPPQLQSSQKSNARSPSARTLIRSRWALAASLALLLLGSLLLPSRFASDGRNGQPVSGTGISDTRGVLPKPIEKHKGKAADQQAQPGLADEDGDPVSKWDMGDMQFLK